MEKKSPCGEVEFYYVFSEGNQYQTKHGCPKIKLKISHQVAGGIGLFEEIHLYYLTNSL